MRLSELAIKQYNDYQKAAQEAVLREAERALTEVRLFIREMALREGASVDGLDLSELQPNPEAPAHVLFVGGSLWLCNGALRFYPPDGGDYFLVESLADLGRCLK